MESQRIQHSALRTVVIGLAALTPPAVAWLAMHQMYAIWCGYIAQQDWRSMPTARFWGGNAYEVLSHWVDVFAMSGNATILAWYLILERTAVCRLTNGPELRRYIQIVSAAVVLGVTVGCLALDMKNGEGTAVFAIPLMLAPTLGGSYFYLRKYAYSTNQVHRIVVAAILFAAAHFGAQLVYEPSETGAPNDYLIFVFPWIALSPLGHWLIKRYRAFKLTHPDEQPEYLRITARRSAPWNLLLVLLCAAAAIWMYEIFVNSGRAHPRWVSPTPMFLTQWMILSLFGAFIAARSYRLEQGASHAALVMSGTLTAFSIFALLMLLREPFGALAFALPAIGFRAFVQNARAYLGLRYYTKCGSAWASRCLNAAPPLAPVTYAICSVYSVQFLLAF